MSKDDEAENIKRMLAGKPYTHEGMTEYGGLPPMSPIPNVTGKRVPDDEYKKLIDKFMKMHQNDK